MDHPGVAGGGNPPSAHVNVYDEIAGNRWRTWLLIGLFVGLVALLAYVLGAVAVVGNTGFFILPFALAIYEIAGNRWRTWLLIGLFVGLVALLAYVLGAVAVVGNTGFFILPFALAIS